MIEQIDIGNFPENIVKPIWTRPGYNDGPHWWGLFELEAVTTGPRFVFYDAWCDYTGFDCQGGIEIYCARDIPSLIQYAMTEAAYQEYMTETQ